MTHVAWTESCEHITFRVIQNPSINRDSGLLMPLLDPVNKQCINNLWNAIIFSVRYIMHTGSWRQGFVQFVAGRRTVTTAFTSTPDAEDQACEARGTTSLFDEFWRRIFVREESRAVRAYISPP